MSQSLRTRVAELVANSPLTSEVLIKDVQHLLSQGEEVLALDTMCSWIYECALPITREYYIRLETLASELGAPKSALLLSDLVVDQCCAG